MLLELPECNTDTFQAFLDEFSIQEPEEYKIVFLDNGAFHKAKRLKIPPNIGLLFLPPYSPELNPAEKVWWTMKREMTLRVYKNLEELQTAISAISNKIITVEKIKSLTAFDYYVTPFKTIFNL